VSLVVLEKVSHSFGGQSIVEDLDLRIARGERVGLVGPNGSGKTTLLRLIVEQQKPDAGTVRRSRGVRVGYLPQDITVTSDRPLLDSVLSSVPGKEELDERVLEAEAELARATAVDPTSEETMEAAASLSQFLEQRAHLDTLYAPHEALRILMGLGFAASDRDRSLAELSGGWKMRALLAALLFQRPDLLLLDEPTNHLDLPSVAWFSDFLERYRSAFILISHDREFLNEQVARIVSFEPEGVRTYTGNYESYRTQRAMEAEILEAEARNTAREREKTERFIERFRYKASKAKAVQSRVKALERLGSVETYDQHQTARFLFPPTKRSGAEILRVTGLAKVYGEHEVFSGLDLTVQRGERIGILGVNGAGKTTLLRIMAGELEPSSGEVRLGYDVRPGYYAQHHTEMLDPKKTVLEQVVSTAVDVPPSRARTLLGGLLFSGSSVDKKISVLSGGERARVALARLLADPGNLMLMDEPTNHLDLDSSEALSEALATFDGTLVFVSHNRSFVRRLATRIWNVEGGSVETYPGSLDEYMDFCRRRLETLVPSDRDEVIERPLPTPQFEGKGSRAEEKARKRLEAQWRAERRERCGRLEREVAEFEDRITLLEGQQKTADKQLADPEVYRDRERSAEALAAYRIRTDELKRLNDQWTEAQEELEAIDAELKAKIAATVE
jgi:ATP-binding cassette subfamily F protein 3